MHEVKFPYKLEEVYHHKRLIKHVARSWVSDEYSVGEAVGWQWGDVLCSERVVANHVIWQELWGHRVIFSDHFG